jgi:hypothetical protein
MPTFSFTHLKPSCTARPACSATRRAARSTARHANACLAGEVTRRRDVEEDDPQTPAAERVEQFLLAGEGLSLGLEGLGADQAHASFSEDTGRGKRELCDA